MGTTRENKYRSHEYTEGKYLICQMGNGLWQPFEMSEFEGEPKEYDPQSLSDTAFEFKTLKLARVWCRENA